MLVSFSVHHSSTDAHKNTRTLTSGVSLSNPTTFPLPPPTGSGNSEGRGIPPLRGMRYAGEQGSDRIVETQGVGNLPEHARTEGTAYQCCYQRAYNGTQVHGVWD